ncbi:MAG: hypothetical protein ABI863_04430 [Ginsengibacter sp.]
MAFFTHGIELNHFEDVEIMDFKGSASPVNPKAYKIYADKGRNFKTDDNAGILLQNVQ